MSQVLSNGCLSSGLWLYVNISFYYLFFFLNLTAAYRQKEAFCCQIVD